VTDCPNPVLRDYVTSSAFVLHLGKTHVVALVRLDLELAAEARLNYSQVRGISRAHQLDVTAVGGLISRGLVVNVWPKYEHLYRAKPTTQTYLTGRPPHGDGLVWTDEYIKRGARPGHVHNITRAGRLVCELLRETGQYADVAGPMLPLIEAARERKRAS